MSDLVTLMALLRGLHLAAMVSLLGTAAFTVWMLPVVAEPPAVLRRRLYRLCLVSGSVAILAGAAWFMLQAAAIADVGRWPALLCDSAWKKDPLRGVIGVQTGPL